MPLDLKKFGEELTKARKAAGLTQLALAQHATWAGHQASDKYIGQLENAYPHGKSGSPRRPPYELVRILAAALNVPEKDWLELTGYSVPDEEPSAQKLVESGVLFNQEFYQSLTPTQLQKLERIIGRERDRRRPKGK